MPPIGDLLRVDRHWAVYALGDLDPRRAQYCQWFTRGSSIALLYHEFGTPILWAAGEPDVLEALPALSACLLQIPRTFRAEVERRFRVEWLRPVRRMRLSPERFTPPAPSTPIELLGPTDEAALRGLYADGLATREDPDFFMGSQLTDGTFVGVRCDGRLVAAGGTHLYSAIESVAAIGNVYTHRSYRGRGYGAAVTSGVTQELMARGTETVALNVRADNPAAIRLYERLGFQHHVTFYEGRASARPGLR